MNKQSKRSGIHLTAIVALSPFMAHDAQAFCSEPSFWGNEPSFYASTPSAPSSYTRPSVPLCLSEYSYTGRHTCDEWELQNYFDEVEDYIGELNDYIDEAASFAEDVRQFAEEAIEFHDQARNYFEEAVDFSKCAAEEVQSQHE